MPIIYRTTGGWGAGKGSNLTAVEVDDNFFDLAGRIGAIESVGGAVGIETITQISPTQFTITLTDSTVEGPFTIPTIDWASLFTGAWQPSYGYIRDQMFNAGTAMYVVIFDHVSASLTFDPNANDGAGNNYYKLIMRMPDVPVVEIATTTYSLGSSNSNTFMYFSNDLGCTINLDTDDNMGVVAGDFVEMHFMQGGVNQIMINAVGGATLLFGSSYLPVSQEQYVVLTLKHLMYDDTWALFGLLAPSA